MPMRASAVVQAWRK